VSCSNSERHISAILFCGGICTRFVHCASVVHTALCIRTFEDEHHEILNQHVMFIQQQP